MWMKRQAAEMESNDYEVVMASIDVRDAFLQVEQSQPMLVHLQNEPFVINRNLPAQRLGAKQWFLHLSSFLERAHGFSVFSSAAVHCQELKSYDSHSCG